MKLLEVKTILEKKTSEKHTYMYIRQIRTGRVHKRYSETRHFLQVLSKSENIHQHVGNGVFTMLKL